MRKWKDGVGWVWESESVTLARQGWKSFALGVVLTPLGFYLAMADPEEGPIGLLGLALFGAGVILAFWGPFVCWGQIGVSFLGEPIEILRYPINLLRRLKGE